MQEKAMEHYAREGHGTLCKRRPWNIMKGKAMEHYAREGHGTLCKRRT